jgi:hypothetical protein
VLWPAGANRGGRALRVPLPMPALLLAACG